MELNAESFAAGFTANDIERSIDFYTKGLGFTIIEEFKRDDRRIGAMMRGGSALVTIFQDDFAKGRDRVKGVGLRCFVETKQDVTKIAEQVKAAGFELESEPQPLPWGAMGFAVKDPDGFALTIANPR